MRKEIFFILSWQLAYKNPIGLSEARKADNFNVLFMLKLPHPSIFKG